MSFTSVDSSFYDATTLYPTMSPSSTTPPPMATTTTAAPKSSTKRYGSTGIDHLDLMLIIICSVLGLLSLICIITYCARQHRGKARSALEHYAAHGLEEDFNAGGGRIENM